ncbi:MAG: hypothetical protein ACO1SV_17460 [Fimbriimonas sp.]
MVFSLEPAWPGYVEAAYTFPAEPTRFFGQAEAELKPLGYRIDRTATSLSAYRESEEEYGPSIHIGPGRATGKTFYIDGDKLTVEERTDWVNVDIIERDIVPVWVRIWAP